jgi:alcohol dehydrogenase
MPGKKALLCVTEDQLMQKLGFQQRVIDLLKKNGVETVLFDGVAPNPTRKSVMRAAALAKEQRCDFCVGLGGGSSIDSAKAAAMMMVNPGDLWEYAYTGTGGKKVPTAAAPVVTVSTTAGTGTETDPYCVITNEDTGEKLDFANEAIFPRISIIDPELMLSLPKTLTVYQGIDALFHAAECYITNRHENRLVDVYARESISTVAKWLPMVVQNGNNLEGRVNMSYAANILSGYTQALICTTSHHIAAQTMGGMFPELPHGASLILIAEEYYKRIREFVPELLDEIGAFMGETPLPERPGEAFIKALTKLFDETGVRTLAMSDFGITTEHFAKICEVTVDLVGIDCDRYTLTKQDFMDILSKSYR